MTEYRDIVTTSTLSTNVPSPSAVMTRLITVGCGNSIAGQARVNAGAESTVTTTAGNERAMASALSGNSLAFPEVAANNTLVDKYGWLGHAGATSTTIVAEVEAELLKPLVQSGVFPDLFWIHSLFENDIGASLSSATSLSNVNFLISLVKSYFPGILFLIATNRPDIRVNTQARIDTFNSLNNSLLALDNGVDTFVYSAHTAYNSKAIPQWPNWITIKGSISGTVLTVDSVPTGVRIFNKDAISTALPNVATIANISNTLTATGGPGTYTIINNGAISAPTGSTLYLHQDSDGGVHPSIKAQVATARLSAAAIKRIAKTFTTKLPTIAPNGNLSGSVSISGGTLVTGSTVPTGVTLNGPTSLADVTLTALNPGLNIRMTNFTNVSGTHFLSALLILNPLSSTLTPNADGVQTWVRLKINSGGKLINNIRLSTQFHHGATTDALTHIWNTGTTTLAQNTMALLDGEELFLCSPTQRCLGNGADFIDTYRTYFAIEVQAVATTTDVIDVDVLGQGVFIVNNGEKVATLVGGTVTIADARVTGMSKITVSRRAAGGTVGNITETARVPGVSVTFTSSSGTDTSVINYTIS